VLMVGLGAPGGALAAPPEASNEVALELDRTALSVRIGQRFTVTSTLRNTGSRPMPAAIAHLNILSIDPGVYVDPEDWSTRRTSYLGVLDAGASVRRTWDVQAVNGGRFLVYVALSSGQATGTGGDEVSGSNALRLTVHQQRTLDAGGVVPLAVAMPAAVLLPMVLAAARRRRLS
jgi:hypothetical protein